ncbi:MAG: MotA/TolQ/ExbB proton channel family protein [Pseudomonadota bacterium]
METFTEGAYAVGAFLLQGGPVIWIIGGLSVLALTIILWKLMALLRLGVWAGRAATERAIASWQAGRDDEAISAVTQKSSVRAQVARAAFNALSKAEFTAEDAEKEILRVAKDRLAAARQGLKALELISTIAPLLGLLGTVIGMITAFQALQAAGARADPATLAGGIWEALLTTAAGMAVAIPTTMAVSYFEGVVDRLRIDIEDIATRILLPRKGAARAQMAAQ